MVKRRDFLPKKKAATGMSILNDKKCLCAPENVIKELIVQYVDLFFSLLQRVASQESQNTKWTEKNKKGSSTFLIRSHLMHKNNPVPSHCCGIDMPFWDEEHFHPCNVVSSNPNLFLLRVAAGDANGIKHSNKMLNTIFRGYAGCNCKLKIKPFKATCDGESLPW